ncbi:MFS transporter [Erwinia sorbitola]|uniref:MFS transporter n=1 Tax=Erwinia sorbitola TaxID=2681984 RepID=A0A6I6EFD3_9GAMM|nr:MFS transporter [Erwinia sorbitola]MTD27036.1 MFS transporter [Erwinia sorbitola]QGU88594.1 MFS transporter [Erwinia sorbitola]
MATMKRKEFPYWIKTVLIFFLGWVVIYAGRAVLGPVMPQIQTEYGLSQSQLGLIGSLFFLAYTLLQIPAGLLGDRLGRKRILVSGFMLFAVFIAAISISSYFMIFIVLWMLIGAAQGVYYGPQYALSSEAIPQKWITLGSAVIGSGMSFGIALGYYLSSVMVDQFKTSWKMPFLAMAVPVVIVTLLMVVFIREKVPQQQVVSKEEVPAAAESEFRFFDLFKNRNLLMAYITIFCSIYGFFVIITWLPYYLQKERGMDIVHAAGIASIVPWISVLGTLICSYISDKIGRRKPVVLWMLPFSLLAIFGIVYSTSEAALIAVLVLYGFIGKISLNPVLIALVSDNAPRKALSSAFSLYNFFGMAASIFAPYLTGLIADSTGSLNAGFYFAGLITIIGFIAMLFVREGKPSQTA